MNWSILKQRLNEQQCKTKEIRDKLHSLPLKRASVLVPLFVYQNQVYVLLTKRSQNLKSQPGDVCFPGGKQDKEDKNLVDTALREAYEEIGLDPSNVDILGESIPFISLNQLIVTPVIGVVNVGNVKILTLNHEEVDDVFACPLNLFTVAQNGKEMYIKSVTLKRYISFLRFLWKKDSASYKKCTGNSFIHQVLVECKYDEAIIYGLTAIISVIIAMLYFNISASFKDDSRTLDAITEKHITYLQNYVDAKSKSLSKM